MKTKIENTEDFKIIAKSRGLKRDLNKKLRKLGITYESFCILEIINNNKNINQAQVSKITNQENSTVSRIIDRTLISFVNKEEKIGYNGLVLSLTKKGKHILKKAKKELDE